MLEVARQNAPPGGTQIEWREGDATGLPFSDEAFDVVLCQKGLQFFPDKAGALREMHRVLAPGGLIGVCVWRTIEHSPCLLATAEALARHVGAEAATRIQAPYALGDADALHALLAGAGFRDVDVRSAVMKRRMLPPEESIPGLIASTPVGPEVAALDEAIRTALAKEIGSALAAYRDEDGLLIPQGTHIVLARK